MTVSRKFYLLACGVCLLGGCAEPYGYYPYGYPPPPPPGGYTPAPQGMPDPPPPAYPSPPNSAPAYPPQAYPGQPYPGQSYPGQPYPGQPYPPQGYPPGYSSPPDAYPNPPQPEGGPNQAPPAYAPQNPAPDQSPPPPAAEAPDQAPPGANSGYPPPPANPDNSGEAPPEAPLAAPVTPPAAIPIRDTALPHFVLEDAWQAGGVWYYPRETFTLDRTGLAAVMPTSHAARTTDNEPYDPLAMMAAMQEVQLPAIAIVTNLDNGRQAMVRVNDRGPADPHRLIALSPGAAQVLGIDRVARVRVRFDPVLCTALTRAVRGHEDDLPIQAAPLGAVHAVSLALLSGTTEEATRAIRPTPRPRAASAPTAPIRVPARPPEDFVQSTPDPGPLMIADGTFTSQTAARLKARALGAGARLVPIADGRRTRFGVETGPYLTVAGADSALDRMLANGATDARIIVADK